MAAWLQVPLLTGLDGISHIFTTRWSESGQSLNLKYSEDGPPDPIVQTNRQAVLSTLDLPLESLVVGQQVHGCHIERVTETERGRGSHDTHTALPATDGLITQTPGVALMVMVADCVPVLAVDPHQRVVGAVHAGWRGTQQHILHRLLEMMQTTFGSDPSQIRVAIGPSIGPCCFEVSPDVVAAFAEDFSARDPRFVSYPGPKPHLDLWAINRSQARQAHVPETQIACVNRCTVCESDTFFSFRKEQGQTGRFAGLISLKP